MDLQLVQHELAPADAIEKAMAALGNTRVIDAFVRPGTPDLVVQFENQLRRDHAGVHH